MDTYYNPEEEELEQENPKFGKYFAWCFCIALLIVAIAIANTSCNTPRKAARIFDKPKNFVPAANYCNTRFPVKVISEHTTEVDSQAIINANPLVVYHTDTLHGGDSIYTYADTIYTPKIITNYKTIHTVDSFESTAKLGIAEHTNDSTNKVLHTTELNLQKQTDKNGVVIAERNKWRLWCLITWGIILLYFVALVAKWKFPFKLF